MVRFVGLGLLVGSLLGIETAPGGYVIVVNAENPVSEINSEALARLFLKKVQRWDDGRTVVPFDQSLRSRVRAAFTKDVMQLSVGELRDYWYKQTFSGGALPPKARSDNAAVVESVKSDRGGIGYVEVGTVLPPEVKTLRVVK